MNDMKKSSIHYFYPEVGIEEWRGLKAGCAYNRKAKVHNFDVAVFVNKQVFGLEIAVSVASPEQTTHRIEHQHMAIRTCEI